MRFATYPFVLGLSLATVSLALPGHATSTSGQSGSAGAQEMQSGGVEKLLPPDIPVTDARGETKGFVSRLKQRGPLIISFMYTNCHSVCDITNGILFGVDQALGNSGEEVTLVSLSIDPARDDPQALDKTAKEYKASDRWLWLTAGMAGTDPLLGSLGAAFDSIEAHDPMFLVGDFCSSEFIRIIGVPEPEALIDLAAKVPKCATN